MEQKLRDAGMRPTRQRMSLGDLLFGSGDRHITAEQLHVETVQAGIAVSLATIYNTLNQFTEAGLLREVAVEGHKSTSTPIPPTTVTIIWKTKVD